MPKHARIKKARVELTRRQREALTRLRATPDEEIDTSDLPVVLDLKNAKRGMFYRPVKQQITLRLDSDVVAWFKENTGKGGRGYQTAMNRALREQVVRTEREQAA